MILVCFSLYLELDLQTAAIFSQNAKVRWGVLSQPIVLHLEFSLLVFDPPEYCLLDRADFIQKQVLITHMFLL